ncbi:sporulation YhaL family protein [Thalassobacillus sp. CUG 92003]|uniref:sporulation YhaL family protein n=1 Tax=Thalassobacillus sp. CUG 92003 TaxID=2736641 RepID=UPI0015E6EF65|nr:sporulation YhaL family protein [Thalassobacillus sp. CUG 92003]
MLFDIPVWVLFCILFIFFSGYMAFRALRAEHRLEQQFIEREGQIYMSRMEKEKKTREHA